MFGVEKIEESELKRIIEFFMSCLDFVAKDNSEHVAATFITGISYICTTGLSRLGNVDAFPFLQNDKFSEFYGLTLAELRDLKKRFSLRENEYEVMLKHYNGYKQKQLLSIFSCMHYIAKREPLNYWRSSGAVENLNETLKIHKVKYEILYMLSDLENTVQINDVGRIKVSQVCQLKTMLKNPNVELNDISLLFTFLMEQGYFSFVKRENEKIFINIPNEELKTEFKQEIREYAKKENYGLNFDLVEKCATYWDKINFSSKGNILFNLKEICKILNQIFKEVKLDEKNEASFHHIMFTILSFTKYKCSSETLCLKYINPGILDLFLVYENCVIIDELKFKKTCKEALECIIERNYCDKFRYNQEIDVYILLGSNMDENKNITMCCLINKNNKEDKIIYIEE